MKKISGRKLKHYIDNCAKSNVTKSTRRFLFNHLNQSTKERGHFHVDQMYGAGSGVLIKFEGKFFLLTAKHVINNNLSGEFQNESPFWFPVKNKPKWESLFDFLFPQKIWNIGELIPDHAVDIDVTDLCLIELFQPQPFHYPDHFIEIKTEKDVLKQHQFFDGMFLIVSGYSFEKNSFDFKPISESITHSTNIHRSSIPGVLTGFGKLSFHLTDGDIQHQNVNGMSGGAVYNIQPKANQVKLAGIAISAGDNVCRFAPTYTFIEALLNYKNSSSQVIDPITNNPPTDEEIAKTAFAYMMKFDSKFRRMVESYECSS